MSTQYKEVAQAILEDLKAGKSVKLPGLGVFKLSRKAERAGFNPLTRQPITIPESTRLSFTATDSVKSTLKQVMPESDS